MSMRSSSLGRVRHGSGISSYAADLRDPVVLPPLLSQSSKYSSNLGLRQMKLPGGADMWTVPKDPLRSSRPPRFREWVAKAGLDLESDAAAWDISSQVKTLRPKFQSAFKQKPRGSVCSSRRSRSAQSAIRAAYLGPTAEEGSDIASTIAEDAASAAATSENFRMQQDLAELRTGDDAVKFFARHSANSNIKVLYCNRNSDEEDAGNAARSLVIVSEHKVKPEHFTISANGVFHVCPGEMSECTPLSAWMHHGMLYSALKSMPFFKLFAYQKNFQHWRENARYEAYCRQRTRLSRSCFLAKPMFVEPLAKLQELMTDVRELPLLLLSQDSQRLNDFAARQLEVRSNSSSGVRTKLESKQDTILEVLVELASSVQRAFNEVPVAQSRRGSKAKSMAQEKQEAREQNRWHQMAERDLGSLGSFIQLADFMFQGARVACATDAALAFSNRLDSGNRAFTVDARFEQHGVVLSPSRDDFSREFNRLWDGVLQAVSSLPSLASSTQVKKYSPTSLSSGQTVEEILRGCGPYRKHIDHIEDSIFEQLRIAEVSADEQYKRYHRIYQFGMEWDEDAYEREAHTSVSLSSHINLMTEFKKELVGVRLHRTFGVIHVNASSLRSSLEVVPEQGLVVMMQLLASLTQEKCITTCQQLSTAIKALDERPTTSASVATYKVLCEAAERLLEQSEEVANEVEDSWLLLIKQGFRITVEDQLQLDSLRTRRRHLEEVKLPQARALMANVKPEVVPDVVVAVEHDLNDGSLTFGGTADDNLEALSTDLKDQADVHPLLTDAAEAPADESIAALLRRQAAAASPAARRGSAPARGGGIGGPPS